MNEAANELQRLYIPTIKQLKPKNVFRGESRCYVVFDGSVCTGDLIAVEADEGCLITRYRLQMARDLDLSMHHDRSLSIMSYSSNCAYGLPVGGARSEAGDGQIVSVFIQPRNGSTYPLKAGESYDATRITYLPKYFDSIDLPVIGNFEDISGMIPNLDDELLSLHLRGLLEDLDLSAAQKPSGMYYYRSKALEALCHVMDMASELGYLASSGVSSESVLFVRRVMEIVESSLAELPSIQELAERLYVGHTYLCETFKAATGLTVGAYARRRRIETAKVLLRDPTLPIKEIASRMGYRTTGGFSAAFKQGEGLTPRQYRMAKAVGRSGKNAAEPPM